MRKKSKRILMAVITAVITIGVCLGAQAFVAAPSSSELQSANTDALESTPVYPPGVTGVCAGYTVVYCQATCVKCGAKYEADEGGPSSDVRGNCIICGGNQFIPGAL